MTTSAEGGGAAARPVDEIAEALRELARGAPTDLSGLLHDVESHATVGGTKVIAHCHCIQLDAHGRPKTTHLVRAIAHHVIDYAIPRREIAKAHAEFVKNKSTQGFARLNDEARKLFTDLDQSGEGGELLLFVLAEKLLGLPQLICKMNLKTSTQMHVHGSDGLHAGVDPETGNLLLYWGESKIYGDVTRAVRLCLASIGPMLSTYSAGERDLQLLQRHADLNDPALETALKKFLDPSSKEFNRLEFRGLCLVGFDCDAYPAGPSTTVLATMAQQIANAFPSWKDHVAKRIAEEKLDTFAMHFLFVPFPSADGFRDMLREHLGIRAPTSPPTTAPASSGVVPVGTSVLMPAVQPSKPTKARRKVAPPVAGVTTTPRKTPVTKRKGKPSGTP